MQWTYMSLKCTENGLLQNIFHTTHTETAIIEPDHALDNSYRDLLHRQAAHLGENGWELISVITEGTTQEWFFKLPMAS